MASHRRLTAVRICDTCAGPPDLLALSQQPLGLWQNLVLQDADELRFLCGRRIRNIMTDKDVSEARNREGVEVKVRI